MAMVSAIVNSMKQTTNKTGPRLNLQRIKRLGWRTVVSGLLAVVMMLNATVPGFTATGVTVAQEPVPGSLYEISQCRTANPATVREEIENAARIALDENQSVIDVDDIVRRKWQEVGADAIVDAEILRAVNELAAQESYWQRLWSAWSADKAEEFATRIAENAFGSQAFATMINALSSAIGAEIAAIVEAELNRAASAALLCLRDYAGEAYGATLLAAFEEGASAHIEQAQVQPSGSDVVINPLEQHSMGLTGAGLIVATEVSRRVALKLSEKVAGRVAGKVAGRVLGRAGASFIPIAGWVVGIGLIVWDLYEGGQGALPQIQEALTSEDVKDRIRADVADAVRSGLPEEAALASLEISVQLLDQWNAFCVQYGDLCTLADENSSFRNLLESTQLGDLGQVSGLVNVFVNEIGRNELNSAIETGDFDRLSVLPDTAREVLRQTRSATTTLAWADLAGPRLDEVVWYGVHLAALPSEFTPDELTRLLDLANPVLVSKVLALDSAETRTLLALPPATMHDLVQRTTTDDLRRFLQASALPHATATPLALLALAVSSGQSIEVIEATPTPILVAAVPSPFDASVITPSPDVTPQIGGSIASTAGENALLPAAVALATSAATALPAPTTPEPWTLGILGASLLALALAAVLFVSSRRR